MAKSPGPHERPPATPTHGGQPAPAPAEPGRQFADPRPSPDDLRFGATADSSIHGLRRPERIPASRQPAVLDLAAVLGAGLVQRLRDAGRLVFHTVGDTGGVKRPEFQFPRPPSSPSPATTTATFTRGRVRTRSRASSTTFAPPRSGTRPTPATTPGPP
jgi:hypothetical protein